jgi:hypothetical protein
MGVNFGYYGKKFGTGLLAILPFTAAANEVQAQQTAPVQMPTVTVHGVRPNTSVWRNGPTGFLDREGSYDITCGLHGAYVSVRGVQDNAVVFPTNDDSIIVQVNGISIKFSGRVQQKPSGLTSREAFNDASDATMLIWFCTGAVIAHTLHPNDNPLEIDQREFEITTKTITATLPTGDVGYKQTNYGWAMRFALGQV